MTFNDRRPWKASRSARTSWWLWLSWRPVTPGLPAWRTTWEDWSRVCWYVTLIQRKGGQGVFMTDVTQIWTKIWKKWWDVLKLKCFIYKVIQLSAVSTMPFTVRQCIDCCCVEAFPLDSHRKERLKLKSSHSNSITSWNPLRSLAWCLSSRWPHALWPWRFKLLTAVKLFFAPKTKNHVLQYGEIHIVK